MKLTIPGWKKNKDPEVERLKKAIKLNEKDKTNRVERHHKKYDTRSDAEKKRWFAEHIRKAGYEIEPDLANRLIQRASMGIGIASMIVWFIVLFEADKGFFFKLALSFVIGVLSATSVWVALHLGFRVFIDLQKFKRKLMIEDVLPDFLQLASANIRAGMPIDRALWFAVRPRFGVLAKEIEEVAKKTLSGGDLQESLVEFANRYDSKLVLRSMNLLNEGIKAGGNVGDLLNKVAINIQELKMMKKEMAANVMTYVIFITFAAIVAGPVLFGLSQQLLTIVQDIAANVAQSTGDMPATRGMGISMNISSDNIKLSDFKIFVYLSLFISSLFSAMIVSTIQKGNPKEGLQYIPIFIIVSFLIYLSASTVLGMLLGGFVV